MDVVKDNKALSSSERNTIRFIYICAYILLSALFLKVIYTQIVKSVFELDLLWCIPTIARETEGLSYIKLISYLLRPLPLWFEVPSVKVYIFFLLSLFGPLAKNFIFASILFHFCCSILLFLVSKKLGLSSRISFLSALIYLTLFAHFHAYMWPMAFQHLIVVFFVLLGLNFYLKTDRLISKGENFYPFFILTLLISLVTSFCSLSILILPAMIIMHILLCLESNKDRIRKYDIWLPLFIIYLIYLLVKFGVGDVRLTTVFRPLIPLFSKNDALNIFIHKINIPTKLSILFLMGASCLLIFRAILVVYQRYELRRVLKRTLITAAIIVILLLIKFGGLKRLLIPYNIIVPFVGILASFLQPLQNALLIDSIRPYHFIPLQLSVFNFLLSFCILVLFIKNFVFNHRQLVILFIFYICNMIYLYLWNPITSRYFIYLSPLFCIIFCATFDYLYSYLTKSIRFKIVTKEVVLILIFVSICIPNLLAIKLALFRGKMANTFLTYDYTRVADAIKRDLIKSDSIKQVRRKVIYINNVIPITFTQTEDFSVSDLRNDNVKFVFKQVFNDASIDVKVNEVSKEDRSHINYFLLLDGYGINDMKGKNIVAFSQYFRQALEELQLNKYMDAIDLLNKAIEERPYLLNYVLGGLKLEDLKWITNGNDMRAWINKIGCFYSVDCGPQELERTGYVSNIINKEIDEYIQCLFYMSFLKYISGDIEESKHWFSKIGFLENDYKRLYCWLVETPLVKSDTRILSFLDSLDNTSLYVSPDNYTDRYKFEKFLFRLILSRT